MRLRCRQGRAGIINNKSRSGCVPLHIDYHWVFTGRLCLLVMLICTSTGEVSFVESTIGKPLPREVFPTLQPTLTTLKQVAQSSHLLTRPSPRTYLNSLPLLRIRTQNRWLPLANKMNAAVAKVLNSVLGDFVENLNSDQLKVSVFNGIVQLSNLQLKSDILNLLGLPLELKYGQVGHLRVEIPWTSLASSPLTIDISDVFALVGPRPMDKWSDSLERTFLNKAKEAALNQFEALSVAVVPESNDPGFAERLVTKIVDNLQITLRSIYVKYEDSEACGTPFCLGLALSQALTYTCNEFWQPCFVADSKMTYKLVGLDSLRLFLDHGESYQGDTQPGDFPSQAAQEILEMPKHRFMVEPTGFTLKVTQNKDAKNLELPQIAAVLVAQDFYSAVQTSQLELIFKFMKLFTLFSQFQQGVAATVNNQEMTQDEEQQYREVYQEWMLGHKSKRAALRQRLSQLEEDKTTQCIILTRKDVQRLVRLHEEEEKARGVVQDLSKPKQAGYISRVGNFFSRQSEADKKKEEEERLEAQREAEARLNAIIEQKSRSTSEIPAPAASLPQDYVKLSVQIELPMLSLAFKDPQRPLVLCQTKRLHLKAGSRPSSVCVSLRVDEISVKDCLGLVPQVPLMLDGEGISMDFDQFPEAKLGASTLRFNCFVNLPCVVHAANTFLPVLTNNVEWGPFIAAASEATQRYVHKGSQQVTHIIETGEVKSNVQLNICLKAPLIVFPICPERIEEGLAILDLGEFKGTSCPVEVEGSGKYEAYSFTLQNIRIAKAMGIADVLRWKEGDCKKILKPFGVELQLLTASEVKPNSDTIRTLTRVTAMTFVIDDDLINFAGAVMKSASKSLDQFKGTPTLPTPPTPPQVQKVVEVVQQEAYRDMIKKVEKSLQVRIEAQVQRISLALYRGTTELGALSVGTVHLSVLVDPSLSVTVDFKLAQLTLQDLRDAVVFSHLIHSESSGLSAPLVHVRALIEPKKDHLSLKVRIEDILMTLHPSLFTDLMDLFSHQLRALDSLRTDQPAPEEKPVATRNHLSLNREVSFVLSRFEVRLPLDVYSREAPVGCASFRISARYRTEQRYTRLNASDGSVVRTDFISMNDDAQLDIKHITLYVGVADQALKRIVPARNIHILEPSRISVSYRCIKEAGTGSTSTVGVNFESFSAVVGFKDLQFFSSVAAIWAAHTPEGSQAEKEPHKQVQTDDVIDVSFECDALQGSLIDDSSYPHTSLVHTNLSNVFGSASISSRVDAKLSIYITADFFNKERGVWEPLLESWDFDLVVAQDSEHVDVSLVSEHVLEINLTLAMASALGTLMQRVGDFKPEVGDQSAYQNKSAGKLPQKDHLSHGSYAYCLKNSLGIPFSVWLDAPANNDIWTLEPDATFKFGQDLVDRLFSISPKKNVKQGILQEICAVATFSLIVEGFKSVKGLCFQKNCAFGFLLESDTCSFECIMETYPHESLKFIEIRSSFLCVNSLDVGLSLLMNEDTIQLQPGERRPLPLMWTDQNIAITNAKDSGTFFKTSVLTLAPAKFASKSVLNYKSSGEVPQRIMCFAPPYVLRNDLPCALVLVHEGDEICTVLPGMSQPLTLFNPNSDSEVSFRLLIEGGVQTSEVRLKEWSTSMSTQGAFPITKLMLDKSYSELAELSFLGKKRLLSPKDAIGSFLMDVYAKQILVNRTSLALECGQKTELKIQPNSVGFLKTSKSALKIRIAEGSYKSAWTAEINIKTVGVSGLLELDNSSCPEEDAPKLILLGIKIEEAPPPLIKSKILYLLPRFVLTNYLPYALLIRQRFKKRGGRVITRVEKDQSLTLHLQKARSSKMIQVSRDGESWSSAFSVENIEDFQVKYDGLQEDKSDAGEWFQPTPRSQFKHVARVIVSTEDEATLYISLVPPADPEFLIENNLSKEISAFQDNHPPVLIPPKERVAWVFDDVNVEKKVTLKCGKAQKSYSVQKISAKKKLGNYFVDVVVNGATRELRVHEKQELHIETEQCFDSSHKTRVVLDLEGIGVSIVDAKPAEKLYLSFIGLHFKMSTTENQIGPSRELLRKFDFTMRSMQLDNMKNKSALYPVIFAIAGVNKVEEQHTPFIQFKLHRVSTFNASEEGELRTAPIDKFSWLELLIQQMSLKVNQEVIQMLMDLSSNLMLALFPPEVAHYSIKPISNLTDICKELNPSTPCLSQSPVSASQKIYFEFLRLCAIKVVVTFKTFSENREFQTTPSVSFPVFSILSGVGTALVNISDTPLQFKEILVQNSFQTLKDIVWVLTKNYIRQGILQFYKLIGSSDLIGNPIGLIDKLGTGVFEFVNEPSKGMLKGPKAFAQGVSKGVRSLVGNVIAGGFGSVSKISGSLYNIVRKVGGDQAGAERINQNASALVKVGAGFTGGAKDLFEGVTGVFTKPYKGAKQGGAAGFFKGVGSGVIGLVVSPLSAALRLGTGVTAGITDAATLLARGRVSLKGRRRFPRFISESGILESYNKELAQAQELLMTLDLFRKHKMVFYLHLKHLKKDVIVILTMEALLYIVNSELKRTIKVQKITGCEVYCVHQNFFVMIESDKPALVIKSEAFHSLAKLFTAVSMLPTSMNNETRLSNISGVSQLSVVGGLS